MDVEMIEDLYNTKFNGTCRLINYIDYNNVFVEFGDGTVVKTNKSSLNKGLVKNPNNPRVFGVGFLGQGKFDRNNSRKIYDKWSGMLARVYYSKSLRRRPTYLDCSVSQEWHNFQNFAEWCIVKKNYDLEGWDLDKDILVEGNKVYSKETCCFVPVEINSCMKSSRDSLIGLPKGVGKAGDKFYAHWRSNGKIEWSPVVDTPYEAFMIYKVNKENYIKSLAEKYRKDIEQKVYEALMKFEVKIKD